MRRSRLAPATVAAALAAAVCASVAWAVFTDVKTNPQSFEAASTWPRVLHMASGSYVGNATRGRVIRGTTFRPDVVIVRADTSQVEAVRTSTMTGEQTKPLVGALALEPNSITALNADGFTVGSSSRVNGSGITYHWTAMRVGPGGTLKVGSYTGNGLSTRIISGLGFSPEYVAVTSSGADRAVQRYANMTLSYRFDADNGGSHIPLLSSDGFTVGDTPEVNRYNTTYHWFAFNDSPGSVKVGSYYGDAADNRNITGVGFKPSYVSIRADAISKPGVHRFTYQDGDSSFPFGAAHASNLIQERIDDGFQIGSDPLVNEKGLLGSVKYGYLALRNTSTPCGQQGTYTIIGPRDTWLDQTNPNFPWGFSRTLRVRSSAGANRRVLIRHTPPSGLELDCEIKSANLALTATAGVGGRTLEAWLPDDRWNVFTTTWNNQPGTTGTPVSAPSASTAGKPVTFDVTAHVLGMAAGTIQDYGWLIKDSSEGNASAVQQEFAAANTSQEPQLVVVIGPYAGD